MGQLNSKIIGFFGSDSYDLVHYLARTITQLSKTVLVIDRTRDEAMMVSVPVEQGSGVLDYRGVDFTAETVDVANSGYDYVFMYYGFDCQKISSKIEECYFVTDCQLQSLKKLKHLQVGEDQFRALIVRSTVPERNLLPYINIELGHLDFQKENTYVLPFNRNDVAAMLAVQYDSVYRFDGVSNPVLEFIIGFCSLDFPKKDVIAAVRFVARGGKK